MKKLLPVSLLILGLWIVFQPLFRNEKTLFDLKTFGSLPIMTGGRIQPLSTLARNDLLSIRGKSGYLDADKKRHSPTQWLAQVCFDPQGAQELEVFRIDHPDVTGLIGFPNEEKKYFSLTDILPHWEKIQQQTQIVNPEAQLRSPFEKAILQLQQSLNRYQALQLSLVAPALLGSAQKDYAVLQELVRIQQSPSALQGNDPKLSQDSLTLFSQRYTAMSQLSKVLIIPPDEVTSESLPQWINLGSSLMETLNSGVMNPIALGYAQLERDWQNNDAESFNTQVKALKISLLEKLTPVQRRQLTGEGWMNQWNPFAGAMSVYVFILAVTALGWLFRSSSLARTAFWLLLLAFVIHTTGLLGRMYIQGRPPVTNLYSSAIFIGWMAVGLCLFLERQTRLNLATFSAAFIGFSTLIIAHHLDNGNDTMEMMRAVLDSNFWLSTHVVTITIGYSANFLAGMLAIMDVLWRLFGKSYSAETSKILMRMAYGSICFGLLFSFIGTVLGGVWADQSWGRFWGWDPKENGALMICLWDALVLHARIGRLFTEKGLMLLILFSNVITSWSWFGTNMLGVGLHSYGFTDSAFQALLLFWISQILLIGMGNVIRDRTLPK
jgi:ABC-type transport system involved in cytochrome c biogenesis permease subunit